MDKTKIISLVIPEQLSEQFSDAVAHYAYGAFPPGRSQCTQVSRETLLDTARSIKQAGQEPVEVSRRQLPMLKAAISWYFGEDGPSPSDRVDDFLAILRDAKRNRPIA